MTHKYYIFDSELVMHPDGKGGSLGTVEVNGVAYHVTQDHKKGQTFVNDEKVSSTFSYFQYDVTDYIAKHQQMSAWLRAQYSHIARFIEVKDESVKYCVGAITFYVYRSEDGTCWRYYTGKNVYECQHYSPWYSAVIPPNLAHFKQWIWESIHMESDVADE